MIWVRIAEHREARDYQERTWKLDLKTTPKDYSSSLILLNKPGLFFPLCPLLPNNFVLKNCRLQRDSNSDSKRRR